MEDLGLKSKDLIPAIGDKGTVSKVLNRKIPLPLQLIRNISKMLSLPAEVPDSGIHKSQIREHGLGTINQNTDLKNLEVLKFLFGLCEIHLKTNAISST